MCRTVAQSVQTPIMRAQTLASAKCSTVLWGQSTRYFGGARTAPPCSSTSELVAAAVTTEG